MKKLIKKTYISSLTTLYMSCWTTIYLNMDNLVVRFGNEFKTENVNAFLAVGVAGALFLLAFLGYFYFIKNEDDDRELRESFITNLPVSILLVAVQVYLS